MKFCLIRNICIIASFFSALAGGVYGQQDERVVKVSLYAFDYAKSHKTVYLTDGEGQVTDVRLSTANIIGPFKTRLDDKLNVVVRCKTKNEDGETVYPAIAKVKIPTHIREPLLVLFPGGKVSVYKGFAIDRKMSDFPLGSYKCINMSPTAIRGLVGKTKVQVASGKVAFFDPSANAGEYLDVHFQYQRPDDWKTFGRTRWPKQKVRRCILFVYLDPLTKRMKIRSMRVKKIQRSKEYKKNMP
ncbi:MAG: hypothetical protein ABGY95_08265 [Rubritalea sp.]|uniref:hypothetical protein n=1 Tax=Rubritalea sp. TaxID=2109375 RepID=UPI003241D2A5